MSITFSNENCVMTKPIVKCEEYITFTRGGKEVGRVSATFDMTKLPPEHHEMALQMVGVGSTNLLLPVR